MKAPHCPRYSAYLTSYSSLPQMGSHLPSSQDGQGQVVPHMHRPHEVAVLEPLVVPEDTRAVIRHCLSSHLGEFRGERRRETVGDEGGEQWEMKNGLICHCLSSHLGDKEEWEYGNKIGNWSR